MEKSRKNKAVYTPPEDAPKMQEPTASYISSRAVPQLKDLTFKDFKKISDKVAISQQEWSDLLHISERTLQRYAKTNGIFSFEVADRILQIDKVIKKGTAVFGSPEAFLQWLKAGPAALEGRLSLQSLSSIDGIQRSITELGRIEQGLFA